jgi:hypothetical protein
MGIAEEVAQMGHRCKIGSIPPVPAANISTKTPCGAKTHHPRHQPVIMKRLPRGKTGAAYTIPNIFYSHDGGMSSIMLQKRGIKGMIFDVQTKTSHRNNVDNWPSA